MIKVCEYMATVIIQLIHDVPLKWTMAEMVHASTIVPPLGPAQ